jgi:hemerythrin
MAFFDWHPSFSVQVNQFDDHHKELIGLLNEAHENYITKSSSEATRVIIDRLVDYAQYHFSAEEKWMKLHDYEGVEHHTAEHDTFWRKLFDFQTGFHCGNKQLSFEVLTYLKDWLYEHIVETDGDYGKHAVKIQEIARNGK